MKGAEGSGDKGWILRATVGIAAGVFVLAFVSLDLPDSLEGVLGLNHRSGLTHSALIPLGTYLVAAKDKGSIVRRFVSSGISLGVAIHLCFDLFPKSWQGYALVTFPVLGRQGKTLSWVWIGTGMLVSLGLAVKAASSLPGGLKKAGLLYCVVCGSLFFLIDQGENKRFLVRSVSLVFPAWLCSGGISVLAAKGGVNMINEVIEEMKQVFEGFPFWIEHTLRVLDNARTIADGEGFSPEMRELVSVVAVLHDIGAPEAMRKHGSSSAKYQEAEGPGVARAILERCGYPTETIDRVCFIVGHHHTPEAIDGEDFQVQWEADALENMRRMKAHAAPEQMKDRVSAVFKTGTGMALAKERLLDQ